MSNGRQQYLKDMGHGECLEAIRHEGDPGLQLEMLRRYVTTRDGADPKQIRRAKRMIERLTHGGK